MVLPVHIASVFLQDFFFDPYANRQYVSHVENVGVFPANERVQSKWNADPYVMVATLLSSLTHPTPPRVPE